MLKLLTVAMLTLTTIPAAFSMPCDHGFECVSDSKQYDISIRRCSNENHLSLESVKIAGVVQKGATLGPSFDGQRSLDFQVNLQTTDGSISILSIETDATEENSGQISAKTKATSPDSFKLMSAEPITCTFTD